MTRKRNTTRGAAANAAGHEPVRALSARYNGEADAYRRLWAPALLPMIEALLRGLQAHQARRILDIGTGVGSALSPLRQRYPAALVVGVDRSMGMLRAAPDDVRLAQMDASALGFADGSCDLVLMAFVLFHLWDPHVGLLEARRVLRPGGTLALTTWAGDADSAATRIWNEELDACGATPSEELEHLARHELMDSPEKVCALLESAGFVALEAVQCNFGHPMTVNTFMGLRTELGRSRRRFESLTPELQKDCHARTRERISKLTPEELTLQMPVVLASAHTAR